MQSSPALGWRMDFIHASVLVLLLSLLLFALLSIWEALSGNAASDHAQGLHHEPRPADRCIRARHRAGYSGRHYPPDWRR
ncbi:MAG: hypothetical protein R3E95_03195 [Thiolinea sp.]